VTSWRIARNDHGARNPPVLPGLWPRVLCHLGATSDAQTLTDWPKNGFNNAPLPPSTDSAPSCSRPGHVLCPRYYSSRRRRSLRSARDRPGGSALPGIPINASSRPRWNSAILDLDGLTMARHSTYQLVKVPKTYAQNRIISPSIGISRCGHTTTFLFSPRFLSCSR
jgi:hypothetical protein